jgi:hypothetical protein
MRPILLFVVTLVTLVACSAADKAGEKAGVKCLEGDDVALVQYASAGNYGAITTDLIQCAQQARAAKLAAQGSGSGSGAPAAKPAATVR